MTDSATPPSDRRGRSRHRRNTGPMSAAPRCGAKTRAGTPCRSPAVGGRKRCYMHGGAKGSGAPKGNSNALKHGEYSRAEIERRRRVRGLIRECELMLGGPGAGRKRPRFRPGEYSSTAFLRIKG